MSAETIIYAALKDDAGIVALVDDRMYPSKIRQGKALPAIVYIRPDTEYVTTIHSGPPRGAKAIMEIWGIAKDFEDAAALGDAIVAAMGIAGMQPVARRVELDDQTEAESAVLTFWVWE